MTRTSRGDDRILAITSFRFAHTRDMSPSITTEHKAQLFGLHAGGLAHLKFEKSARALRPRLGLLPFALPGEARICISLCAIFTTVPAVLRETSNGTSY